MRARKVLVVTDSLHPCGVREVVLILLQKLAKSGCKLTFCGAVYPTEIPKELASMTCKWLWSVCISKTGMRTTILMPLQVIAIGFAVRDADLIVIESNSTVGACTVLWTWVFNLVALILRRTRKKIIFHAHTQADEYVRHFFIVGKVLARAVNRMVGLILNRVDLCICPSNHFAEMLRKRLCLRVRPTVWTAPLNMPRRIKKYPLKWLYKGGDRKIPLGMQTFLCNGRLGKEKGTDELLQLFGKMHEMGFKVGLIFIGSGNIAKYRRIADVLPNGAGQYVSFFGSLPHDRLLALTLAGGSKRIGKVVGISLSSTETQGLVIHEMWWLALAVAVLANTCFSDDIGRGGGGVLLEGSLTDFANALICFMRSRERLRECGLKGQEYVQDFLSYEKCADALLGICSGVMAT